MIFKRPARAGTAAGAARRRRSATIIVATAVLAATLGVSMSSSVGAAVTRIMPLGDSLTSGLGADPNDGGYRNVLEDLLAGNGYSFDFVGSLQKGPAELGDKDHEGHSGFLISDIAAGVNTWLNQSTPDIVLLMIGTNDVRFSTDPLNMPARLESLLDQMAVARPSAHIIVATIPLITETSDPTRQQALANYNAAIPNIVGARATAGRPISMVDPHSEVNVSDLLPDGVHLNSSGQTKVASRFYQGIAAVLAPTNPTTTPPTTTGPTTTVPPSGTTYLSNLNPTSASNGFGPYERDRANGGAAAGDGPPLRLKGVTYPKGLGTHAPASILYSLGGAYSSFLATIGIDDIASSPDASVVFQVFADDVKIYDSGIVTSALSAKTINVSVAGRANLRLVVTDAGNGTAYDWADWADARLSP